MVYVDTSVKMKRRKMRMPPSQFFLNVTWNYTINFMIQLSSNLYQKILTALNGIGSSLGWHGPDKSKPSSLLCTSR